MKISIFTTITNPEKRQDAWIEALKNYSEFANEVIVVNGGIKINFHEFYKNNIKSFNLNWPYKWHWAELPRHLNAGLSACTGDWAIKMDIDYFFHEKDFKHIREKLEKYLAADVKAAYLVKFNILNRKQGYEKAIAPICINTKFRDKIQYGIPEKGESDWCWPIFISSKTKFKNVPFGRKLEINQDILPIGSTNIYNYDYFFKDKEITKKEFWRFAQAHATAFNDSWGKTKEESWQVFINMMKGRLKNPYLKEVDHPKHLLDRINRMMPDKFGYDNWQNFKNLCV